MGHQELFDANTFGPPKKNFINFPCALIVSSMRCTIAHAWKRAPIRLYAAAAAVANQWRRNTNSAATGSESINLSTKICNRFIFVELLLTAAAAVHPHFIVVAHFSIVYCTLTASIYTRNIHEAFLPYAKRVPICFFVPSSSAYLLRAHFSFNLRRHNIRSNLNMGDQRQQWQQQQQQKQQTIFRINRAAAAPAPIHTITFASPSRA